MGIGTPNTSFPQPKTNFLSALDQLHKLMTGAGDEYVDDGSTPPEALDADPQQRSAHILSGKGMMSNAVNSPELQTAELRSNYKDEAIDHLAGALGAGPKYAPDAARASRYVDKYNAEETADPNSYTNMEGRAKAERDAAEGAQIQESTYNRPGQAKMRQETQASKVALAHAEHPNPNVSPFADPNAPTGQQAGAGNVTHGIAAPPGVDPARWAAGTNDLTPEAAAKVAAALQYNLPIPSGNVLARPEWATIVGRALKIDPSFDYKQFDQRKAYMQDFARGKTGNAIQSLDTVMHHLDSFNTAAEGLHNTGVKPWNWLTNELTSATVGNPSVGRFEEAANAVAGELSNVFKATGATDHEIKSWRDHLSTAGTPDEFKARVSELTDLINGRMSAVGSQYQRVMGRPAPDFLSQESRQIFDKFNPKSTGPHPGEERVINGQPAVWDGHGWVAK